MSTTSSRLMRHCVSAGDTTAAVGGPEGSPTASSVKWTACQALKVVSMRLAALYPPISCSRRLEEVPCCYCSCCLNTWLLVQMMPPSCCCCCCWFCCLNTWLLVQLMPPSCCCCCCCCLNTWLLIQLMPPSFWNEPPLGATLAMSWPFRSLMSDSPLLETSPANGNIAAETASVPVAT